jgi:hypothetical protein
MHRSHRRFRSVATAAGVFVANQAIRTPVKMQCIRVNELQYHTLKYMKKSSWTSKKGRKREWVSV